MIHRDDLHITHVTPKAIAEFCLKLGGKNPYGEPLLRVCLAQDRYMKVGGQHKIWRKSASLAERGGYVEGVGTEHSVGFQASPERPLRTEVGLKEVPAYPNIEGWILERWYPANVVAPGGQSAWENFGTRQGGVAELGPYPEFGLYDMIAGPTLHVPEISALQMAYQYYMDKLENKKGTVESRFRQRVNRAIDAQEEQEKKFRAEAKAFFKDVAGPVWSTSLAGGRLRTKIEERLRARGYNIGHIGN